MAKIEYQGEFDFNEIYKYLSDKKIDLSRLNSSAATEYLKEFIKDGSYVVSKSVEDVVVMFENGKYVSVDFNNGNIVIEVEDNNKLKIAMNELKKIKSEFQFKIIRLSDAEKIIDRAIEISTTKPLFKEL